MKGVSFENLRKFLYCVFFYNEEGGMTYEESCKYILPKQHNFFNPIVLDSKNRNGTFIEYWYDEDDAITWDANDYKENVTHKKAYLDLRFLGVGAEELAKSVQHLNKRPIMNEYAYSLLNGRMQSPFSPIRPITVDYFGQNSSIVFDTSVLIVYDEVLNIDFNELESVSLGNGNIRR